MRIVRVIVVACTFLIWGCGGGSSHPPADAGGSVDTGTKDSSRGDSSHSDARDSGHDAAAALFQVGGTVSGLQGTGLVLQNNAGDSVSVSTNGAFSFLPPSPAAQPMR